MKFRYNKIEFRFKNIFLMSIFGEILTQDLRLKENEGKKP
jgi:hypothetical protein